MGMPVFVLLDCFVSYLGVRIVSPNFLSVAFGATVGFALGLTGGGGSLLAVPLLVYGLAIAPRDAFGISLAAVGAMALSGVIPKLRAGQVEVGTGILFAIAGMLGAPLGTWVAGLIPESLLLTLFAVLMVVVAVRMWTKTKPPLPTKCDEAQVGPTCQRTETGQLRLTSKCAVLLLAVGLLTGFLSGLFGVGGGFVIVPALVLFSGMPIRRAIATSLLVIVLVSISGVSSQFLAGREIPLEVTGLFVAGGVLGTQLGSLVGKRLDASMLQKVFAIGIVAVACYIGAKSFV